jgi:uncharacterized protein YceK
MKIFAPALLVVLLGACGTYSTHDRYYERDGQRVYGASAPVQDHELICHKGKKTMSLPASAVQAHLNHGARRGSC